MFFNPNLGVFTWHKLRLSRKTHLFRSVCQLFFLSLSLFLFFLRFPPSSLLRKDFKITSKSYENRVIFVTRAHRHVALPYLEGDLPPFCCVAFCVKFSFRPMVTPFACMPATLSLPRWSPVTVTCHSAHICASTTSLKFIWIYIFLKNGKNNKYLSAYPRFRLHGSETDNRAYH